MEKSENFQHYVKFQAKKSKSTHVNVQIYAGLAAGYALALARAMLDGALQN